MVSGFGPHGPHSLDRREFFKLFLSRVGHDLPCTLHGPGVVQVLERLHVAFDHPLSRVNDTLQSALVSNSGGRVPNCDEAGQDGPDGSIQVHH